MYTNALFAALFISYGVFLDTGVSGRSPPGPTSASTTINPASGSSTSSPSSSAAQESSLCPAVVDIPLALCMQQTRQDARSCSSDADCFLPGYVCCRHFCGTRVCKRMNGDSAARDVDETRNDPQATGKSVPTNIKHRQNVLTIDELAANYLKGKEKPPAEGIKSIPLPKPLQTKAANVTDHIKGSSTINDSPSTKSSLCPAIADLPFELCMQQNRQDARSCRSDTDCFLPGYICCRHYCGTRVCKRISGDSATMDVDETRNDPKLKGKSVPTNIKHRQNVPTIDELAANFLKRKTKPPAGEMSIPLPKPAAKVTIQTKVSSAIKDSSTNNKSNESSLCPAEVDLPLELCMQQTLQDAMSCSSDVDCFLPGYVCCRHFCGTHVCKRIIGDSATRDVNGTGNDPKAGGKSVPTNIKHRQNVLTIDGLAAIYLKSKAKPSAEESRSIQLSKESRAQATTFSGQQHGSLTINDSSASTKSNGDSATRDVDKTRNEQEAGGQGLPTNGKHRQNEPTNDELAGNYLKGKTKPRAEEIKSILLSKLLRTKAATVEGQNQGSSTTIKSNASSSNFCPRVANLPLAMCIQRRRRHAMPCNSDGDCFLPGYKCCPHYCNTHACKRPKGKRPSRTKD